MGIFKRWRSKRDKPLSQDFEDTPAKTLTECLAYIVVGADVNGDFFVASNYTDDAEGRDKLSELVVMFFTGVIADDLMASVRQACRSEKDLAIVLSVIGVHLQQLQSQRPIENANEPVVDPCNVFRSGDNSEFKG